MDMQQVLELLLAETNRESDRGQMLAEISARTKSNKDLLARLEAGIDTSRKSGREDLKGMMAEMKAKMDTNWDGIIYAVCAIGELIGTIQREMRAAIQSVRSELDEMTTCREATETELDPGMVQPIEEVRRSPRKRPQ
jgi:hypothetical protein